MANAHSGCLQERTCLSLTGMDVIRRFVSDYWQQYGQSITLEQRKALQAILLCRTAAMGGHRYVCTDCAHEHFAYHSCNHRLCPQCGCSDTQAWVHRQLRALLPVPYFMVTFTLPQALRELCLSNCKFIDYFFKDSSQALNELLADPKRTHFAQNGFFGVYQSWKQDMGYHPHIHYVVPAVGLSADNKKVIHLKKPDFLIYAQPLANRLRTLLMQGLKEQGLVEEKTFWELIRINWNVSVDPAGCGENAVKYLGQYIRKSVISDHRIVSTDAEHVLIRIKDRDTGAKKLIRITGIEFIRRLLLHVLPAGFHRVRYRGFLHARGKPKLKSLQVLLFAKLPKTNESPPPSLESRRCPRCGTQMELRNPLPRAPPLIRNLSFFQALA